VRKILLHYQLGNISVKDLAQYYAGMVDGVQNDAATTANIQRVLQETVERSTINGRRKALDELRGIIERIQKVK